MTTTDRVAPPGEAPEHTGEPAVAEQALTPADPGDRGTTTLATKVVEKTASQAALEVEHTSGLRRHIAGRGLGNRVVRTQADIDGHVVGLSMELAIDFPQPVRTTTRSVRAHVVTQVERYCGLTVDHLDISVTVLRRDDTETRRVQ